ncbi:single-stranded DNA-binding protein [[Brevibacterium] flavum]|uniref:Single-stranded DNA-binding protein n=1 Tax=[Brevibacterium] flavum TaxID=92706 RepID=A0A0F6Z710_9CORY|nr:MULTISPECIES: single-stranded DNA-binding protein [Corynebacterium]AKF27812.1 single-stranded DNA-binding protein [[Brevibacterium] flavum]ANE08645.1 single-stranded DNA-binding protein [Corynebacterium glutamicum]AST21058.1 single-stranded DNA-binding protein [Corynebacterium glutamicum ATCC 14067]KEI23567.1 single-stranded DNA-binding protein [Corynebacterium glutamicum ATCC 14067]KIH73314.1 single-stranded DNA-binding protein [Corynebacterium glutamicum]
MAIGDTNITVVGNMVADPELRFTPSGAAVCNFRMASTPRSFNRQTNQWEDGEALFLTVNVWRQAAENVAESLSKGMRVIVTGRLKQRSYETREGEKRSVFEVEADEVGPSLTFAYANVHRQTGKQSSQRPPAQEPVQSHGGFGQAAPANDPWNSAPPAGSGGFGAGDDEPPF